MLHSVVYMAYDLTKQQAVWQENERANAPPPPPPTHPRPVFPRSNTKAVSNSPDLEKWTSNEKTKTKRKKQANNSKSICQQQNTFGINIASFV